MNKKLLALFVGLGFIALPLIVNAVCSTANVGGTGICSATTTDIGKVLTVSSSSPFTFSLSTSTGSGSSTPLTSINSLSNASNSFVFLGANGNSVATSSTSTVTFGNNSTYLNTPSTLVSRDVYGNSNFVNVITTATNTTTSAQTVAMTAGSGRIQRTTGTSTIQFNLPDATTMYLGESYEFDNDSAGNASVYKNDGVTLVGTVIPGAYMVVYNTNNSTTNGIWMSYFALPSNAAWGTSGLSLTGTLAVTQTSTLATTTVSKLTVSNVTSSILATDASGNVIATTTSGGGSSVGSAGTIQLASTTSGQFDSTSTISYSSSTGILTTGDLNVGTMLISSPLILLNQTSQATGTFTVPTGITSIIINAQGSASGANGGSATGTLAVTPGGTYYWAVGYGGATGNANGGGASWFSSTSTYSTSTVIIVGGGAGGVGTFAGATGGTGGGLIGGTGSAGIFGGTSSGGTQTGGGAGGVSDGSGGNGQNGSALNGGTGGTSAGGAVGGGGGGGYYGGGGGGGSGAGHGSGSGAGGSSYTSNILTSTSTATGTNPGGASITITINPTLSTLLVSKRIFTTGITPVLSSCGSSPLISGNNTAGTVTGGTGSTGCTITFNPGSFLSDPTCTVTPETVSIVNAFSYSHTTSTLTVSQTGLGTGKFDYICLGK